MNTANICEQCGTRLESDAQFCAKCGAKTGADSIQSQTVQEPDQSIPSESSKSSKATFLFCIFLGMFGVHRFYVGKIWTGLLMLISLGAFGVWVVIDLILIVKNKFKDKKGSSITLTHNLSPRTETILVIGAIMLWFALFFASLATITMVSTKALSTKALITVANNQLTALQTGQMDQAYSYTSKDYQKYISIENFRKYVDQSSALKNNQSSNFDNPQIVNNKGSLSGTLTEKDGTTTRVVYQLIKEQGQWKISYITIIPISPKAK